MNHSKKQWNITDLMPLTVFFLFALCLLTVLLTGAGVYRNAADQARSSARHRTAVQYLTTRVRQGDALGQISVEDFSGTQALVITEQLGSDVCRTLVYCHEGYLKELFCTESSVFFPKDGEKLIPMEGMTLVLEGDLLRAQLRFEDTLQELTLALRSGKEAPP